MTWLLVAAACLATSADVGYLQGAWGRPSSTRIATKVRASDKERASSKGGGKAPENTAEARKLTGDMKRAKSAEEFLNILGTAVDRPIFNDFHASCAYHSLATWKRRGKLAKTDAGLQLPKLNARVREMIGQGELPARGIANVLWSLAYLFDDFPEVVDIVPFMAKQIPVKAKDMKPQELSNVLWAAANLKDDTPDVMDMVPSIVAEIQVKAKDMKPQELSNVLWAAARWKEDVPDVIDMVPSIVAQIPVKAKDMKPQELSNVLWAAANLKDDTPDVMDIVPSIVSEIPVKAKNMTPQHLSNVLWAAAKLKDDAPDVMDIVPSITAQIPVKSKDMIPQHLSNILWGAARLREDTPEVLDMVPAILSQIPVKAKDMNPQDLSSALMALVPLQDLVPGVKAFLADETASNNCFVQFAASRTMKLIPKMKDLDLTLTVPMVVWACAKLGQHHEDLLSTVAKRFGSPKRISRLSAWGLCSLHGSYHMLDPSGRFSDFSDMLKKELTKRGFSDSDVGWSLEGPLEWARTNK